MRLRRLNAVGIRSAAAFITGLSASGETAVPKALISGAEFTEEVAPATQLEHRSFATRLAAAEYLGEVLAPYDAQRLEKDVGLWTWLALFFFESLCPRSATGYRPGALARWIPESEYSRYYRHLLAGPYRIYTAYRDDPEIALSLLAGEPHQMGELVEQIASRIELVTNRAVVGAATRLYVDPVTRRLKLGAGGKGPGSPRRYAAVLNQLDVTWDLYAMEPDELVGLLPAEFERFKRSTP